MDLREELEQILDEFHSGDRPLSLKDHLAHRIRDMVALSGSAEEPYRTDGESRAGGDPDLPADMEWPKMRNGRLMTFIAQINLAEAAAVDKTGLLPVTGMLYFFLGDTEPYTHMEHQVIFRETVEGLKRTGPSEAPFFLAERRGVFSGVFSGVRLTARSGLNIPSRYYAQDVLRRLEDNLDNEDRIEEFYEDYNELFRKADGEWICKMFGYGRDRHGDLEYEAALRLHADLEYNCYQEDALKSLTAHFEGDAAQARKAVENTLLLLEVRSDDDTGFMWGESGVIHYFIDREDLAAMRFDRTYASVYSD